MTHPDFIHRSRELYDRTLLGSDRKLLREYKPPRGTKEAEIIDFEKKHDLKLPLAFKQYLLWMGDDVSGIFRGSDCFFKDLEHNNELLPEFLDEYEIEYDRSRRPFCCFSHQGYVMAWFYLEPAEADPVTYLFADRSEDAVVQTIGRFSDFLFNDLSGLVSIVSQGPR